MKYAVWQLSDHRALVQLLEFNVVGASSELVGVINILELWPVLCAIRRLGPQLIISRWWEWLTSRSVTIMNWIRELFWLCFVFYVHLVAVNFKSSENITADMLCRLSNPVVLQIFFNYSNFFTLHWFGSRFFNVQRDGYLRIPPAPNWANDKICWLLVSL